MTKSNKILLLLAVFGLSAITLFAQETGVVINGVTWATRNVDMPGTFTENPEDVGMYYKWNSKVGWTLECVPSDGTSIWNSTPNGGAEWENENNPCPEGWRVPTREEFQLLCNTTNVINIWDTENGVNGRRFTDITNSTFSIFLPVTGLRNYFDGTFDYISTHGLYWSSSVNGTGSARYNLNFSGASFTPENSHNSADGLCVRCVKDGDDVGINEVSTDTENATITGYFDVLGRKLNEEPKQGFYIRQYSSGTVKKVMKTQD
jgi:uncharacterized protein (TIGR02145 family)